MDRNELLNDSEESFRAAFEGKQVGIWTAMPCVVQKVDLSAMTCEAQPAIQATVEDENGNLKNISYPLLVDVPLVMPRGGGFALVLPIAVGDEVLVVFASRCIDAWWQSGGVTNQAMEARMHDLSDGFAIPGPSSQPKVLPSVSTTAAQLRNTAGTTYVGLTPGGLIQLVNPSDSGKTILNGMIDLTKNLETALQTFTTSCAAALDPTVAAAATALGTALTAQQLLLVAYKLRIGNLFQ